MTATMTMSSPADTGRRTAAGSIEIDCNELAAAIQKLAAGQTPTSDVAAEKLGFKSGQLFKWRREGRMPIQHLLILCEHSGVPRHQIAPSLYEGYKFKKPVTRRVFR